MKQLMFLAPAMAATLTAAPADERRNDFPLVVNVLKTGEACRITVDGAEVTIERLFQLAQAGKYRRGIIVFRRAAPYKCVGGVTYTLQRAGLAQLDAAPWDAD